MDPWAALDLPGVGSAQAHDSDSSASTPPAPITPRAPGPTTVLTRSQELTLSPTGTTVTIYYHDQHHLPGSTCSTRPSWQPTAAPPDVVTQADGRLEFGFNVGARH